MDAPLKCCVCASTVEVVIEPRFAYVVCKKHEHLSPIEINNMTINLPRPANERQGWDKVDLMPWYGPAYSTEQVHNIMEKVRNIALEEAAKCVERSSNLNDAAMFIRAKKNLDPSA